MNGSRGKIKLSVIHPDVNKTIGRLLDNASDWYPEISKEIETACGFFLEDSEK